MNFAEEDVGKSVFDANDEKIGIVVEVEGGTAYVEPEPSLTEELRAKLGWGDTEADEDAYALQDDWVKAIEENELLLRTRPES